MSQFSFKAENIKCGGCASTIENGLKEMAGIEDVSVNIESGEVTVTADGIDESTVKQKVTELGYPAS